jgi:phosphoadenosine phosphosulfate reductase
MLDRRHDSCRAEPHEFEKLIPASGMITVRCVSRRRATSNDIFALTLAPRRRLTATMLDRTGSLADSLAAALAPLSAPARLVELRRTLSGRIVFTHGFGVEGQLIFHWLAEHDLDIDVVTLDTGRLFPETYALWAQTERRYGRRIRAIYPERAALEAMVDRYGIDGFYDSKQARHACCNVRKVKPLDAALDGAAAWITGARADQTETRREAGLASLDGSRGLIKFNPLFDWSRTEVLDAVAAADVPVNALHAQGYVSIGCAPCTRAVAPGEPERNGRWWWETDGVKECGLHVPRPAAARGKAACG